MSRLTRVVREVAMLALIATAIMFGMDWLRAPQLPDNLAQPPLSAMQGEVDLAQLSQQSPVLVYVWASWCGVCKLTTSTVASLSRNGTQVVSVALRSGNDARVATWLEKKGVQGIAINDESGVLGQRWQINATPTFMVLYKGRVVSTTSGWTSSPGLKLRLWWATKYA
ncbi:Thiol:disulfide interchange protein DsbE [Sodalis glossinidius str. 'morsitans']|uniref:Suppressor for copper-sensitivity D n=1 Tax=Sodalis glossinidius (strain morsitans) TaxID=343509 RepID=Q2NUX9_SODGM|nr:protein disulfide oxidoreductase [Sodalis glossinidius]BAE74046.1 suppressor for copper-sensitivity D [Sodalis glossinidius str. 'morsitans']CRL44604.1 Thiol:disulfide interchange protein DsbE [Sodalis glossinidius str. 'morsitans']